MKADAQQAPPPEAGETEIVLGRDCSWQGTRAEVASLMPEDELFAAQREKREPDWKLGKPCCPYCGGPVGRASLEMLDKSLAAAAEQRGENIEFIREIMLWQPGRCFPTALDHVRAWYAEQKREARAAKRRGLH